MNPFDPSRPATTLFVGRAGERRSLGSGLAGGMSFALIGGAGMGKTSLLRTVHEDLRRSDGDAFPPIVAYLQCERGLSKNAADVLAAMVRALREALALGGLPVPEDVFRDALRDAEQEDLTRALHRLLDWTHRKSKRAHRPVFLLDDLHRLIDQPWLGRLASLFHAPVNQREMALVLTGKEPLDQELRSDVSKLRHLIADRIHLSALELGDVEDLVVRARKAGCRIDADCAEFTYKINGGHPYCVQYYFYKVAAEHERVTVKALRALHERPETRHHLREILGEGAPAVALGYDGSRATGGESGKRTNTRPRTR